MVTTTGQAIRQELQRYGLIRLLGQATGGSTTKITDSLRLEGTPMAGTKYDGCWLRTTSLGTVAWGEQVMVDYLDSAAGDLFVDPVFSGTPSSALTYEVWRAGINPDELDRLRDEALTTLCSQWLKVPVSIVENAGYLEKTADEPDNFTASSATLTQEDADFPDGRFPFTMLVTNSGANGAAKSDSIFAVRASDSFYLYVPVSTRVGTSKIIVRDITNGADIALSGTTTETRRGWSGFEVTGQVPATCDAIQVWLVNTSASGVSEFGPVFMQPQGTRQMPIRVQVNTDDDVGPIYALTRYPIASGQGNWGQSDRQEQKNIRKIFNNGVGYLQWSGETVMLQQPHYYEEQKFYTALSADYLTVAGRAAGDAATTVCPLDYAAAATCKLVAEKYALEYPSELPFWQTVLVVASERLGKYQRKYGPDPKASLTRERDLPRFWVGV